MQNDSLAVTAKSPELALEALLKEGESDPRKLIAGLRAKGFIISAGVETEEEELREGEPEPMDMDSAISDAIEGAVPLPEK